MPRSAHKWLYHLDACAGSVLTPHDNITNVQKRLGGRWPMLRFLPGPTAGTRRNLQYVQKAAQAATNVGDITSA